MELLDLPVEILVLLPNHLHNIEDFKNASSSCRTLRNAFWETDPHQILQLAGAASRTFFRPDPYFLIAATVRQVRDWALESQDNSDVLRQAFMCGIEGLYDLCIAKASLTMDDIRRLHAMRFTTLNPVADLIDKAADQIALEHALASRRWREAWERVRYQVGEDFEEEWRQSLWHSTVECQGLEGLEMLTPAGLEKWRPKLVEMRTQIKNLKEKPEMYRFGRHFAFEYPHLAKEVLVSIGGYGSNR
ncbi:uncharacterized protein LY89DRAFT_720481 [Mollisia scopiformis]|uniref:F-box domain-containing protein n=1 Tax=Mollisia scopiformis TaxID=149040 RepID=A0A194X4I2_MOLSC|nr:uncharacterized protein LY89DRAFT_720481 [Mollisia scopiformis]KUJ15085.1 hypothetical protein LY89DRAFT_720481 [Mollisia scopiformis]